MFRGLVQLIATVSSIVALQISFYLYDILLIIFETSGSILLHHDVYSCMMMAYLFSPMALAIATDQSVISKNKSNKKENKSNVHNLNNDYNLILSRSFSCVSI